PSTSAVTSGPDHLPAVRAGRDPAPRLHGIPLLLSHPTAGGHAEFPSEGWGGWPPTQGVPMRAPLRLTLSVPAATALSATMFAPVTSAAPARPADPAGKSIELTLAGTHETGVFDESAIAVAGLHAADGSTVDDGAVVNSVAVSGGLLAVAVEAADK